MKKTFLGFVLLLVFMENGLALDSFKYETSFLPNKKLVKETSVTSDSLMNVIGSPDFIKSMEKEGKKFPISFKSLQKNIDEIETGSIRKDGGIDIKLKTLEKNTYLINNEGKMTKLPTASFDMTNTIIFMNQQKDGTKKVEKIESESLSEEEKNMLLQVFSQIFTLENQLGLANKTFKIGDKFLDTKPLNIPVAGSNIRMKQNSEYTLRDITKDNVAIFDILATFDIDMDMNEIGANGKIEAYGTGLLLYDIKNHIEKKNDFSMNLNLEFDIQDGRMVMKSNMKTSVITKTIK